MTIQRPSLLTHRRAVRHVSRPARGFMLMEVLVSVLIFTLGVLGLVGLQASMSQAQSVARSRAEASNLASELSARMWADLKSIDQYADGASCANYAPCKDWQDKVSATLPRGAGSVSYDATNGTVTVTVMWTPAGGDPGNGADQHKVVLVTNIKAAGAA